MKYVGSVLSLILLLAISFACQQQNTSEPAEGSGIYLNQIGFYVGAPKIAIIRGATAEKFTVVDLNSNKAVFEGQLGEPNQSSFGNYTTRAADFTILDRPGSYVIQAAGLADSYPFEIEPNVMNEVSKASIKGFYYQRMSVDLPEIYAGKWARAGGHADTGVFVHSSAATSERPTDFKLSAPKGWYDAGDYNKYIVNSGITMGTLLSAYEDFPAYYSELDLNIPESDNDIPDLLEETLWNLRWMLRMQDTDGGVYHKLTTAKFEGMVMPENASNKRWVVQKSTAATLDFAAVTAQASRIFANFESQLPGLADSCLTASKKAWKWAQQNPEVLYNQNEMNKTYDPDITTGAYGDKSVGDEFIWAACELYISTGDEAYYSAINLFPDENLSLPSWGNVRLMGYYSLARFINKLPHTSFSEITPLRAQLINFADGLLNGSAAWQTVMGGSERDFVWGSSAVAANQGVALLQTYRLTNDKKYLEGALSNMDYLLGRNATGYSFVTGHGDKTPMYPHHRPSVADGIDEPVPGLLSGGPNPGQQDGCEGYPSNIPDESFVDNDCSYASNEIAINWNAPLVYLLGAMEVLYNN
ncbi:MAG: glycoside hydrolase family 9 protein [Imperialibacter sp.]